MFKLNGPTIIFLAVLCLFQLYYFTALKPSQDTPLKPQIETNTPKSDQLTDRQSLTKVHLLESEKDEKAWEVWAESAVKEQNSSDWDMTTVTAKFYSEGQIYDVVGDSGHVNEATKQVQIKGNVKLITNNNYAFSTEILDYSPNGNMINTGEPITVLGPKELRGRLKLNGVGLEVHLGTDEIKILDKIKGRMPMSDGRIMNIASLTAKVSGVTNRAEFKDQVIIKVDDMRIDGNYAEFKYVNRKLHSLVMDGGIHLKDTDKYGSSGRATVLFDEDKYLFEKQAFINQGKDELIGDTIIVFNGGKRVQVINGKAEYHRKKVKQ